MPVVVVEILTQVNKAAGSQYDVQHLTINTQHGDIQNSLSITEKNINAT